MPDEQELELEPSDEAEGVAEEHLADELKKLKAKLKLCQTERQEYLDASQRLRADYVNLKRASEQERDKLAKFASERLVLELLGIVDNFDHALADRAAWEALPAEWRQGMEQIASKLRAVLSNHGVVEDNPLGQSFDPALHQAVGTIDTDNQDDDNTILAVLQKGYRLHGRVIRPASVKVGHKS